MSREYFSDDTRAARALESISKSLDQIVEMRRENTGFETRVRRLEGALRTMANYLDGIDDNCKAVEPVLSAIKAALIEFRGDET